MLVSPALRTGATSSVANPVVDTPVIVGSDNPGKSSDPVVVSSVLVHSDINQSSRRGHSRVEGLEKDGPGRGGLGDAQAAGLEHRIDDLQELIPASGAVISRAPQLHGDTRLA